MTAFIRQASLWERSDKASGQIGSICPINSGCEGVGSHQGLDAAARMDSFISAIRHGFPNLLMNIRYWPAPEGERAVRTGQSRT